MTKSELVTMTGSEEQANYALEILLSQVKADFVRMAVNAELKSINAQIKEFQTAGYLVYCNGIYSVNWGKVHKLDGWHLTEEQEAERDKAYAKCQAADSLLYRRNRTLSLIATR